MAVITRKAAVRNSGDGRAAALRPLAVDVALPVATYWAAHSLLGLSLVVSLGLGSVVPAVRTAQQLLRSRSVNGLALLMLVVNLAGAGLSLLSGDPRLMIAKDAVVSSVIGLGMLVSAFTGRPIMSAGMRPFIVKGKAARDAAWDRLASGSAAGSVAFRRHERNFTLVWGTVLAAECVVKAVAAYTLPVETMAWLGTVMLAGAVVLGISFGNPFAGRVAELVVREAAE
ncbi:VC0807 family protein [Kitasatospora sp. McL0602]|uniref:VC0807 family protein n=1 Tax=Kitasatospora sp. McL0602 TaxID=3439530 RepID=UPI003F8A6101